MLKRGIPLISAISFGGLTLISLLFSITEISSLILEWASFLAAVALLLGAINLLSVHTHRLAAHRPVGGQNIYSAALVISMLVVFGLGMTDLIGLTNNSVGVVFNWIQAPLEAALASLLAFFLLLSGIRLLQRQRTIASILFLATAVLILLSNALIASPILPQSISSLFQQLRDLIQSIIVTSGIRGILIGVALGAITLSIRLLLGLERPYNK